MNNFIFGNTGGAGHIGNDEQPLSLEQARIAGIIPTVYGSPYQVGALQSPPTVGFCDGTPYLNLCFAASSKEEDEKNDN